MVQNRNLHNEEISKYKFSFWVPIIRTLSILIDFLRIIKGKEEFFF